MNMRKGKHVYSSLSGDITLSNEMFLDCIGHYVGNNTDVYLGKVYSAEGLRDLLLSHWYNKTDIELIVQKAIQEGMLQE